MPKTFKAIGFDWAGVISVFPLKLSDHAQNILGVPSEEFHRVYFKHNHIVNKGDIPFSEAREMWTLILKELGKEELMEPFLDAIRQQPLPVVDQDMLRLVRFVKALGFKVGLLSNASLDVATRIRRTDVDQMFDASLFSAEIGFIKPQPEAFQELARRLEVSLSDLVFIDDGKRSLSTALELGYEPILYRGMDGLLEKLTELSVLSSENVKQFREAV